MRIGESDSDQEVLHVVGPLPAEDHVVFLFAAWIGVPDEVHLATLERPVGETLGELGQNGARVVLNVRRVEIEDSDFRDSIARQKRKGLFGLRIQPFHYPRRVCT